ncbi:MAG TPA: RraA family protein [Blastocatellia bacterium]|nr:RraA family protein [Blastocatellia bacterium]HMV84964.1 RraA family protein [Blastocatellia bacterium]HMX27657.1 RraA family protein [Blastocatellia bacterium]HMY70650.1 RraA family protein [Blastocatellia bacterium]HMZ16866.1 RraA family protein [Blastocatellia bacterium]
MSLWKTEEELFAIIRRELFTAVIGDVMDKMGLQNQFLPPRIQPLRDDMLVIGRAMPVLEADVFDVTGAAGANPLMAQPFGLMLRALDDLKAGEVYVCAGGSPRYALWGELMSTRALQLGAAGAVMNGYSRDTPGILQLNFPTFSWGRYAQDQGPRGKVIDFRCTIEIEGVRIVTGDLIVGDLEGVLVVPQSAVAEAISLAVEKARGEKLVRNAIEGGMSATEAFEAFGIM